MKINLSFFALATLICIGSCAFAQLDVGNSHGMFPVDVTVDKDESVYLLTYYNSVQVFSKDRSFVRKFLITDGEAYPSLKSIVVDADKQLHVVDDANDVIHVYSNEGTFIKRIALEPGIYQDVAMDETGRYYLAERGVNVVRIFDTDGNKIQEFGSDVFGSLYSIHVAANGHIFTCDIGVYLGKPAAVRVFDSEGNYLTNVGVSSGGYGGYTEPTAVQTDATGYIYIYSGSKVLKFYQTFEFREEYRLNDEARGIQYAGYAFCIANNKLFFADNRHRIQVFDKTLVYSYTIAGASSDEGKFNVPEGIAVDENDHIYVVDSKNHRIQIFDADGNFKSSFGSNGRGDDQFFNPADVKVDRNTGFIYVLDQNTVKKFSREGVFIEKFATEIPGASRLALDNAGLVYVNSLTPRAILVFSNTGILLRSIPVDGSLEGITIGPDDLIYVTVSVSSKPRQVQIFSLDGNLRNKFDVSAERQPFAYGIVVMDDYVFVSDKEGVYKFHKDGTLIATLAAGRGDALGTLNMVLENGVYRTALAVWKDQLLISDVLRVQSFAVKQRITFPEIAPKRFGDEPIELAASSSSGMPVTYTVSEPAMASINHGVATIHKPGTTIVTANQDGAGFLEAAEPVSREISVSKGEQHITFHSIGNRILGEGPISLVAESNVGLPIKFMVDDPSVAITEGNTLTLLKEGSTTIVATQEGNAFYDPAWISQPLVVSLITGVEREVESFKVYPNPTRDRITVPLFDSILKGSVTMVNNLGQRMPFPVGNITTGDNTLELSLRHLNAGIYYLYITTPQDGMTVHKVIKL